MRIMLTAAIALVALTVASAALAGGSITAGYGGAAAPAAQVKKQTTHVKGVQVKLPKTVKAGTLPFTGADLGWFALGASMLVGLGVGLRRVAGDRKE